MKNYASKYTSFINYDKIYSNNTDIKAAIENKMMPYDIDEYVCGDGAGFETLCKIHKTSYHDIMPELISFIGEENYVNWLIKTNQKDQDISSVDLHISASKHLSIRHRFRHIKRGFYNGI